MERSNRILGKQEVVAKKAPQKGAFENGKKADTRFDPTRRRILKATLLGLTGSAVGAFDQKIREAKLLGDFVKDKLEGRLAKKSSDTAVEKKEVVSEEETSEEKDSIDYIEINAPENSGKEVAEEDAVTVRELVNFDSREPIKLGLLEIDRVQKNWEKRYYNGDKKRDLDEALLNMKDWEGPAKEVFMAEGEVYCQREKISGAEKVKFIAEFENYFYLSIPESYWRLNNKSCANAVGPFQFMEKTAREYGLKCDEGEEKNFDERRDPVKSAKAAAQFLLRLYDKMDHNWDLALSNYNGGFAGKFKEERAIGQELNYANFLEYLREKIALLKRELSSATTLTHKVIKNNDSLKKIAKLYGLEEKTLASMNKLAVGDKIKVGDKIIIPPTQDNRRKNFYYHIDGFSQNINYPAKLYAVLAVIKRREQETGRAILNQKSNLSPEWKEDIVKQESPYFKHIITREDTLSGLAKKYGVSMAEICQKNKLKKPYLLSPGESLRRS